MRSMSRRTARVAPARSKSGPRSSRGRSGLAALIERNCAQARWLAEQLRQSGCEVLNEVVLNQIVVSFGHDETNGRVLSAIQRSGELWCGGTNWRGKQAMRISVSSWATTQADLERALAAILRAREAAPGGTPTK